MLDNKRTILHADMNNAYASIEMLHHPKLRGHPVAIGGSAESRHGIILARNYEARPYGVKVGQALWEALDKCPGLIIVPPDYGKYLKFSGLFFRILSEYSSQVEPFGLDEAWADVSDSVWKYGSGKLMADEIRERVKSELGISVSIGVSYNKIFAKLGSDLKKPDATTVISEDNYREVVWPVAASELLGVGRATRIKLLKYGICTIGDIAAYDPTLLQSWLGKWGLFLWIYANGKDSSPVCGTGYENAVKSVGNSTTTPRDLENEEDCRIVFLNLAESVAERLRELNLMAKTAEITLRANDLSSFSRRQKLKLPTHIATELTDAAMELLRKNYGFDKPLRSIGIRAADLVPIGSCWQSCLFADDAKREKIARLEFVVDDIRRRFGHFSVGRALLMSDAKLGKLNPKAEHVIHPVGYR